MKFLLLFVFIVTFISFVNALGEEDPRKNRLSTYESALYTKLTSIPSYILLNNNGMVGSYPKKNPVYGKTYHITDNDSLQTLSSTFNEYIFIIPDTLLSAQTLSFLTTYNPKGVLVYPQDGIHISADKQSSFSPTADGLAWLSFDFPIYYISDDISPLLKDNIDVKINGLMYGFEKSEVCLRRGMCNPIGGHSIVGGVNTVESDNSILLTSKLDGVSFFRDITPANEEVLSGVSTLLGVLDAIKPVINTTKKSIKYAFFEGETFGHMGSRQYKKENDKFSHIFNFGNLGLVNDSLYAFANSTLPTVNGIVNTHISPPESALNIFDNGVKIHLADHNDTFKGSVGTHRDVLESIDSLCENIQKITQLILGVIYERTDVEELEKELNVVYHCDNYTELYHCLAFNLSCNYFNQTIGSVSGNPNSYPSVFRSNRITPSIASIAEYVEWIVQPCTSDDVSCSNGTIELLDTYGSDIDVNKYKIIGDYGDAWTESNWGTIEVSYYVKRTSTDKVIVTLSFGIAIIATLIFIGMLHWRKLI
ncbi:Nicastrin [Entamoeba marina]